MRDQTTTGRLACGNLVDRLPGMAAPEPAWTTAQRLADVARRLYPYLLPLGMAVIFVLAILLFEFLRTTAVPFPVTFALPPVLSVVGYRILFKAFIRRLRRDDGGQRP